MRPSRSILAWDPRIVVPAKIRGTKSPQSPSLERQISAKIPKCPRSGLQAGCRAPPQGRGRSACGAPPSPGCRAGWGTSQAPPACIGCSGRWGAPWAALRRSIGEVAEERPEVWRECPSHSCSHICVQSTGLGEHRCYGREISRGSRSLDPHTCSPRVRVENTPEAETKYSKVPPPPKPWLPTVSGVISTYPSQKSVRDGPILTNFGQTSIRLGRSLATLGLVLANVRSTSAELG